MYHISNYGFADPDYMEHYGIVGMKWRHRHGPVHRDAARRRQLNQIREEVDKTKNYVSDPHNAGARINKEKYDEATRKLRNPQKTSRSDYTRRRVNQARKNNSGNTRTAIEEAGKRSIKEYGDIASRRDSDASHDLSRRYDNVYPNQNYRRLLDTQSSERNRRSTRSHNPAPNLRRSNSKRRRN